MGDYLEDFQKFTKELQPWEKPFGEAEYDDALKALGEERYLRPPVYGLEFEKALTGKRRYFRRLVDNKVIGFLNQLCGHVQQAATDHEKCAIVAKAMKVVLPAMLREVVSIVRCRKYKPKHYERRNKFNTPFHDLADDAYIIFYSKHMLVCLYMETQELHVPYLPGVMLSLEDVYLSFCDHNCTPHVVRNKPAKQSLVVVHEAPEAQVLIAFRSDLRPPPKGVLPYADMVKNPERYGRFEQELFASMLIDHQHRFRKSRGAQTMLAMTIAHIFRLGYFHEKVIPGLRPIRLIEVIRFAEHRYQVSLYRLVRNALAQPKVLDGFVRRHRWLEMLPKGK